MIVIEFFYENGFIVFAMINSSWKPLSVQTIANIAELRGNYEIGKELFVYFSLYPHWKWMIKKIGQLLHDIWWT